jgi:hypothetical protein
MTKQPLHEADVDATLDQQFRRSVSRHVGWHSAGQTASPTGLHASSNKYLNFRFVDHLPKIARILGGLIMTF